MDSSRAANMFRFNMWARGPFLHPGGGGPGSPAETAFPLPAHLAAAAHAGMLGFAAGSDKDGKDAATSQPSGFPMFRPGEPLPAGFYSPLHQQFLRAQLDIAASQATAAAAQHRAQQHHQHQQGDDPIHTPIPSHHFILNSHPSAFMPANKRLKLDEDREEGEIERGRGGRVEEDERMSGPPSPSSRQSVTPPDRSGSGLDLTLDSHRGGGGSPASNDPRCSPAPAAADGSLCCPVCRCRLESEKIDSHLAREMHDLANMYRKVLDDVPRKAISSLHLAVPSKSRYETYMRIRGNREHRLSKLRGIRRKRMSDEMMYNGTDSSAQHEEAVSIEEEAIDIMSCDEKTEPVSKQSSSSTDISSTSPASADTTRCNGCKEPFSTGCSPMASTTCWHVYCSKCWQTESNTCPQCRQPVQASDLRRIYL